MNRVVHPIEERSYEILRARADTSRLPPCTKAVVERVIHASADFGYLDDLVCTEADLAAGAQALRDGAPVVADSPMTRAGAGPRVRKSVRAVGAVPMTHTAPGPTSPPATRMPAAARVMPTTLASAAARRSPMRHTTSRAVIPAAVIAESATTGAPSRSA